MKSINLKLMLVVLLTLFASSCGNLSRAPSDKSMEERFRANEADFNKLIAMLKEDKLFELTPEAAYLAPINNNESPVKTELPAERMEEYRRLLRQTGANRVIGKEKVFNLDFFEGDAGLIFSDYLSRSHLKNRMINFTDGKT
jgi:hypothetical protein